MQPQNADDLLSRLPADLQREVRGYLDAPDQAAMDVHLAGPAQFLPATRQYLADAGEDAFFAWIWSLPENDPHRLAALSDDALRAVFERKVREQLFEGATGDGPSAEERREARLSFAARFNSIAAEIARAVEAFNGEEDEDDVQAVANVYPTFMEDVQAFQNLANESQLAAAAAVYNTGAEVGPLLAQYLETHDAEVLAQLRNRVGQMCEAAARANDVAGNPDPGVGDGAAAALLHLS
ncbi:MAG: hypothetical protein ACR2N4_15855 [Jatrophihabitans sp.]